MLCFLRQKISNFKTQFSYLKCSLVAKNVGKRWLIDFIHFPGNKKEVNFPRIELHASNRCFVNKKEVKSYFAVAEMKKNFLKHI